MILTKKRSKTPMSVLLLFFFTPSIRYGMCLLYLLSGMCVRQSSRVVLVIDSQADFPCGSCHNKIMQLRSLVRQYHFLRQVRSLYVVISGNLPRSLCNMDPVEGSQFPRPGHKLLLFFAGMLRG